MTSPTSTQWPEILTLGEPLIEFNQTTPLGKQYLQGFGGDVSTVAIAASRFGTRAAIITCVGNDHFGDLLLDLWHQERVDTQFVTRDPNAPTGVYFVSHNETGHRFSYLRSGSAASRITPAQLPLAAISSARWLHVSAISQAISESSSSTVSAAIAAARAAGTHISYDPNLRLALWPLDRARQTIRSTVPLADLFLPSLEDVITLSGASTPEQALDWCLEAGARQVVLKLGARGALAYIDGQQILIEPKAVQLVDATGAGDCFAGVLLASLCAGETMLTALTYANAAAATATTGFGAVAPLPTRHQVLQMPSSKAAESAMSASDQLVHKASTCGVIPTLVIEDLHSAVPLAQALRDGGLTVLEITLRTPIALQAIQQIRHALPDLFVGAGTVLDVGAAEAAQNAGAQFLVSPGYTAALGDYCRSKDIALMPGVATASEIMAVLDDGYDFLKCFPAAALGGVRWLDAMRGPFPNIRFCPTGGISAAEAGTYLSLPNVLCVGGSWVAPGAAVSAKDWTKITALARQAYEAREPS